MQCFCGLPKAYDECCGRFIDRGHAPSCIEELMRSRYSAYTQGKCDYIQATMQGPAAQDFVVEQARTWALSVKWQGLTLLGVHMKKKEFGFVEFIARYSLNNKNHFIHEKSEFHLIQGKWFYVDGKLIPPDRNHPCLCGSGKKFKKCCY